MIHFLRTVGGIQQIWRATDRGEEPLTGSCPISFAALEDVPERRFLRAAADLGPGGLRPYRISKASGYMAPEEATLLTLVVTGSSVAVSGNGVPVVSTQPRYPNHALMPAIGNPAWWRAEHEKAGLTPLLTPGQAAGLVPLVEGKGTYHTRYVVETCASGFANSVIAKTTHFLGMGVRLNVIACGGAGKDYASLKRGSAIYENVMTLVRAAQDFAAARGWRHRVGAVTAIYGQRELYDLVGGEGTASDFAANLGELQADYSADAAAVTGQADPVPLLTMQFSAWSARGDLSTNPINQAMIDAHDVHPHVHVFAPQYQHPHDCVSRLGNHLSGPSQRAVGVEIGCAFEAAVFRREKVRPLRMVRAVRGARWVDIDMSEPTEVRVRSSGAADAVADPGHWGFEYLDDGGTTTIVGIDQLSPTRFRLHLGSGAAGRDPHVGLAWSGPPGVRGGPETGSRSCLRSVAWEAGLSPAADPQDRIHKHALHQLIPVTVP